jgi:hypothetical protein
MQTGQNSIAPENSLPQVGQVRWTSVLIVLAALQLQAQPRTTPGSTESREIGQHGPWADCSPVPQAIAYSFTLARQVTFRNKIPAVTLEVAVMRVVSQALAKRPVGFPLPLPCSFTGSQCA